VIAWDRRKNYAQSLTLALLLLVDPGWVDLFFLFPDISILKYLFELKRLPPTCQGCENPLLLGMRLRPDFYPPVPVLQDMWTSLCSWDGEEPMLT